MQEALASDARAASRVRANSSCWGFAVEARNICAPQRETCSSLRRIRFDGSHLVPGVSLPSTAHWL